MTVGDAAVLLALACGAGLAVRRLVKNHKSGRDCGGDCSQCGGCRK